DPMTVDPATVSEPPAPAAAASEGAPGTEAPETLEPAPSDDIAEAADTEPTPLTPTAASTDDPQEPEDGAIGPGETATFSYPVTGARFVYVYAIGGDLAVTVVRADGSRLPVPSNGSVHSKDYYWIGQVDGTWKLEITNTGTSSVTPEHGLTYSTDADRLDLTSSIYAPALRLTVNPTIGGVPRSDLTVWSEVIGPDGSRHTQQLSGNATSYTGLPSGDYFARVWTVVDGVTYQESRVVGVHVAESDPPSVVISTTPATPNTAGWFRTVSLNFMGSDSGSG